MTTIKRQAAAPWALRYANSILVVIIALTLSAVFWDVIVETPFMLFFAAVALSAWFGGLGPGLVTTLLSIILSDYFLFEPRYYLLASWHDLLQFTIFGSVAFLISWTEHQRLEAAQQLQEAHDELNIILDGVLDAITAQTSAGQPVFANHSATVLFGYPSADTFMQTPLAELRRRVEVFDIDGNPILDSSLPRHKVFETGESSSLLYRRRFVETGEERWISLTSSPIFDDQGQVKLCVNIMRDITDQFETERPRAELAAVVQYSYDAIISLKLDHTISSWNPSAERLFGYSADEAIGQPITLLFPPDIREQELQLLERLKRGELIQHYQTQRIRKDGRLVDVSLTVSPIRDINGKIIGYSKVERDISESRKLEKLREENARFIHKVLDTLPIMTGVMTPDSILTDVNRTALDMAGVDAADILGLPLEETPWWVNSPAKKDRLRNAIEQAKEGSTVRYDETLQMAPDRSITIDFTLSPMFDEEGQVTHLIPSGLDISERTQREEYILNLSERIQEQTRRLNSIIANIPGIVFEAVYSEADGEMKSTFISNYVERLLGYTPDTWKQDPQFLRKVIHPEDVGKALQQTKYVFESQKPGRIRFRLIAKDERVIYAEAYVSVLFDEEESPAGICGVIMDITERKQAQDQLLQLTMLTEMQHQRLSNVVANVPGIVYDSTIDLETMAQEMNFFSDYAETMLGYSAENWRQDPGFWRKVIHPGDNEHLLQKATEAWEQQEPGVVQFRCFHKNGTIVFVEAYFRFQPDGNKVKSSGVIMDITHRKKTEEALEQYMQDLRRSNEELEQFAYIASHDLQEPLRKVASYLQLIEQRYYDKLDEDGKDFITFAVDGATRMKSLIKDLLTYSRVQRSHGDFEEVSLNSVLDRVLNNLQLSIEDTNARITADSLPNVIASERQMQQLFQNLLSNAIKFRKEERPEIHIGVEQYTDGEWLFTVQDNGIGIEQEYLNRIFIIFQRLHSKSKYPGTGIGLAICKKVVENHGGRIWVESQLGQGTKFFITLCMAEERVADGESDHVRN